MERGKRKECIEGKGRICLKRERGEEEWKDDKGKNILKEKGEE